MSHDPLFGLDGKTIVMTGACGLIGRTAARAFLERGANLVLADLEVAEPAAFAGSLGEKALGVPLDVTDEVAVDELLALAIKRFGRVDILINAHQADPPGFDDAQPENFPTELFEAIIDVNLKGTFFTCRSFGAHMLKSGGGVIVNLASAYGLVSSNPSLYEDNSVGNPLAYSASKGGVLMLSKYLGVHWASRGVRVNCLTPHGVWSNHEDAFKTRFEKLTPIKRMMKPEEIVGALVFLSSEASSYTTASNLLADGGWTAW